MDGLPDDVVRCVFGRMTDARTMASLAATCRRMRAIFDGGGRPFVRRFEFPVENDARAACPENVAALEAALRLHPCCSLCACCYFCKALLPVHLAAVIVLHRCTRWSGSSWVLPTCKGAVLFADRDTSHLEQPRPVECRLAWLDRTRGVRPAVPPYT